MIRKRVIVRGRVQGVGFRWSAQAEAEQLGVAGYARNLPDGTVQAELEGPADAVQRMLDWLHHGPPYAQVEAVDVTDTDGADQDGDGRPGSNRFMIR
ncbi:acylphosphatase [Homoserinimonas sp. A447]